MTERVAAAKFPVSVAPADRALLQRCGGHLCGCTHEDDERPLRRQRGWGKEPDSVPPVVYETLRSPAQPLDAATRSFFEPRFGHDFARVRVHTDAKAAESSRAVNALAYTVGRDVVFSAGRFTPGTAAGRRLLAHELTHVVQQSGAGERTHSLALGPAADGYEREADAAAGAISRGADSAEGESVSTAPDSRLQRQGFGDVRISEGLDRERAQEEQTRGAEKGAANMAGRVLTQTDLDTARAAVPSIPAPTRVMPGVRGARFVLHDTAALVGAKRLTEVAGQGRRSAGVGAGAFVPRDSAAVTTHTPFFGPRRPTATQFERGQDIMVKADREKAYRAVWQTVDKTKREAALDALLTSQGSPAKEAAAERKQAIAQLAAASGDVNSAGAWAVEDLCAAAATAGATSLAASPAQVPALETACQNLSALTITRAARIASTVNVEIVAERGTDCRATGKDLKPLPPYTASQYDNVAQLYVRAAFEAKFFPEITTHFLIDKGVGDHCDPRCFRLPDLYARIAALMTHPKGTTYGITPSYGTGAAHNVWWNDTVCGGPHP
jgi:hypothetical protein